MNYYDRKVEERASGCKGLFIGMLILLVAVLIIFLSSKAFSQESKSSYAFSKIQIKVSSKMSNIDSAFNTVLPKQPVTDIKYKAYDVMILDKKDVIIATKINGKKWKITKGHTSEESLNAMMLMILKNIKK